MQAGITDPLLKSRAAAEVAVIQSIENTLAVRTFGIPFVAEKNLLPAVLDLFSENSRRTAITI